VSRLVARWLSLPPNLRGILWVAISGLLFALLNVFTLIPAQHLNSYVMAFLRCTARCTPGGFRSISSAARSTRRA
jgi:hypothetical protein